jgi:hypothetical protein
MSMQFFNGAKLKDFLDTDVHVIVTSDSAINETLPLCHSFVENERFLLDLMPQLAKKYVVEIPEDVAFSKNESELSMGRYGIIIPQSSAAGLVITDMIATKRRLEVGKKKAEGT